MKLLVIVLCLLSERFLMHSLAHQRFSWFTEYCNRIHRGTTGHKLFANPWLLLIALVAPIVLAAFILYSLLQSLVFGFLGLLLSILIVLYCLGPNNVFYPVSDPDLKQDINVGNYFAMANSELFSIIFWYIIAGPIFIIAYRLITLCQNITAVRDKAVQLTDILEWIPARITVLLYLLVGNFQRGFSSFLKFLPSLPTLNKEMLSECGLKAVRSTDSEEVPMPVAEGLVEHAAIVFLVLIALFTLAAWL